MRGRDIFNILRPIWVITHQVLRLIPNKFCIFFWDLSNNIPTFIGLFIRYCLMVRLAQSAGDNIYIGPGVEVREWNNLIIGSNVSLHKDCYLDAKGGIQIGDNVSIAHQSSIVSFEHTWLNNSLPIKDNPLRTAPIIISNDVWIGCGVRILSGVYVGHRSIIAAGAVVRDNVKTGSLVAGVPAKLIKLIIE